MVPVNHAPVVCLSIRKVSCQSSATVVEAVMQASRGFKTEVDGCTLIQCQGNGGKSKKRKSAKVESNYVDNRWLQVLSNYHYYE